MRELEEPKGNNCQLCDGDDIADYEGESEEENDMFIDNSDKVQK